MLVDERIKDLGNLKFGEPHKFTYTLTNDTDHLTKITRLVKSCSACTDALTRKTLLQPGESTDVEVTYTPGATGAAEKKIQVLYDKNENLTLVFKAFIND